MARSIYCSSCKKEKEPGRDNESCCKTCKSERNKAKRARLRSEKGMEPFNTGRSLYCYTCKALKENRDLGYCNACRRKKDNEDRLSKGVTKKHQTGLCPCGAERASYNPAYCVSCAWAQKKNWLDKNGFTEDQIKNINEGQKRRYRERVGPKCLSDKPEHIAARNRYHDLSPESLEEKFKIQVRALTRSYIKSGKLVKMPCEVCGKVKTVEAHHDDYTKPMDIRWLCKAHHEEHHHSILRG